jgi:hypothetical protein
MAATRMRVDAAKLSFATEKVLTWRQFRTAGSQTHIGCIQINSGIVEAAFEYRTVQAWAHFPGAWVIHPVFCRKLHVNKR